MTDQTVRTVGPPAPPSVEYLTLSEAAQLLRTPTKTLYAWRHQRCGPPSYKIGRRVLYRRDELNKWVRAQAAA